MYEIVMQKDLSHAGAKRYNARVITEITDKDRLREIVVKVIKRLKYSNYYRDNIVKKHFGNSPADVVWLNCVNRKEMLINMFHSQRLPLSEIALEFSVDESTVTGWCKELGIDIPKEDDESSFNEKPIQWTCQTQWVHPLLAENMRPLELECDEIYQGIRITWGSEEDLRELEMREISKRLAARRGE